jgi:hypothetical protein
MTCALRSCHQSLGGGEHGYLPLLLKPLSFPVHLPFPISPPRNPMDLQLIACRKITREKTLIVSVGQVMKLRHPEGDCGVAGGGREVVGMRLNE